MEKRIRNDSLLLSWRAKNIWIIKEEKTKTVDEIKDTVERIEKLFEGQLELIISNMKK